MNKKNNKEKIRFLMSHGEPTVDLCKAAYEIILMEDIDKQVDLFRYFISNIKYEESDNSMELPPMIEPHQIIEYSKMSLDALSDFIDYLYKKQVSESEFYEKLWGFIQTNSLFDDDIARSVALFNCLKFMNVPYVELDFNKFLFMTNDEFKAHLIIAKQTEEYQRVKKICNFSFKEKTQKYSLLLNELDSCKDDKARVMMLILIAMSERKSGFNDAMNMMLKKAILSDDK